MQLNGRRVPHPTAISSRYPQARRSVPCRRVLAILSMAVALVTVRLAAQTAAFQSGSPATAIAHASAQLIPNQQQSPSAARSDSSPANEPQPPALLPDSPQPQDPSSSVRSPRPQQTKRILGIIPNFRAVSTDDVLPPQTPGEKLHDTTEDSFDYSSAIIPAVLAGYDMGRNTVPEFHQGAAGYGRYLWHAAVDQTTENYFVGFVFPVITHEDSRYYTLARGSFLRRTGYALSRAVVTRTDSGHNTFNISEVAGAGASAGLSNVYYPAQERTFSNTAQNWGLDIGIDAFTFALKEFWPDVNQRLFHSGAPPPAVK